MAELGTATLRLDVDSSRFNSELDGAEKKTSGLGRALGNVATIAGGFIVAEGLMKIPGLIGGMVSGASDLNESWSKVQVVFGDQADEIKRWASTAPSALLMTKGAALEAVGTFGNFLQAMGETPGSAADMSKAMVGLAADMASFNNASPEEVLLALRSGLSGEAEPLKKFGVALSEAAVSAKAMELGIDADGKAMTEQQKIAARYAIIMDQTSTAQGDVARTADGWANQSKILKAELGTLAADIGTALMPAFLGIIHFLVGEMIPGLRTASEAIAGFIGSDVMPKLEAFAGAFRDDILPAVKTLAETALPPLRDVLVEIFDFISSHQEILGGLAIVIGGVLVVAFTSWAIAAGAAAIATLAAAAPAIAIGVALTALAAGIIYLVKNWDDLTERYPKLKAVSDALQKAFQAFAGWITGTFVPAIQVVYTTIAKVISDTIAFVRDNWDTIVTIFEPPVKAVLAIATFYFDAIKIYIETVIGVIQGILKVAMGLITGDWGLAWEGVRTIASSIWQGIHDMIFNFIELIKGLVMALGPALLTLGQAAFTALWEGIKGLWSGSILPWFEGLPDAAKSALQGIISTLRNIGVLAMEGLWNGLKSMKGKILDWLGGLAGEIGSKLNPANWIGSPKGIQNWMPYYMNQGLQNLERWANASESRFEDVAAGIAGSMSAPIVAPGMLQSPVERPSILTPDQYTRTFAQGGQSVTVNVNADGLDADRLAAVTKKAVQDEIDAQLGTDAVRYGVRVGGVA